MQADRVTKALLAVIALLLLVQTFERATAQAPAQRVMVCGAQPPFACADVRSIELGGVRSNYLLMAEPVR